jgi:hypothetical protein
MRTTIWLRVASVISLLFAAGHTLGGRSYWSPQGDNPVLQLMRSTRFHVMGVNRTYFDFFLGFGYSLSVYMVLQAVLLWQIAGLARTDARRVRPMIAAFAVAIAAGGVISWFLIFPLPAGFSLVMLATLVVAWLVAR